MKSIISLLFVSFFGLSAYAQVVAIQNDRQNTIYLGLDNPLTVAASGYAPNRILVTTDNGIVDGEQGHYIIRPDWVGPTFVFVKLKTKKGWKTIDSIRYNVQFFPDPVVFLGGKTSGIISVNKAKSLIGPAALIKEFIYCSPITIDSCTIMVVRKGKLAFLKSQNNRKGVKFSDDEATFAFIKTLRNNDKIFLTDITCRGPDGRERHLKPVELTIADDGVETEK